jgi:hypothetical protein
MPILAAITHGVTTLDFPDLKIRRRDKELDEITQTFQRPTAAAIVPGMSWPGRPGFRVLEAAEEEDFPSQCYLYQCRGIGIAGGLLAKEIDWAEDDEEEGWDMATRVVLTGNKNLIPRGAAAPGIPTMLATSVRRRRHPDADGYWYLEAQYKGINGDKPEKIRITMNGREVSREALVVAFNGGWDTPAKSEILWPRVTLTKSYLSAAIPTVSVPTQSFGRPSQQAPAVFEPIITGAADPVLHWPNGWTLADVNHEPLAGSSICYCQEVWTYNHRVTL